MIIVSFCLFFAGEVEDAITARQYGLEGTQEVLEISDDYYYKLAVIEQARKGRELTVLLKDKAIQEAKIAAFNECLSREGF